MFLKKPSSIFSEQDRQQVADAIAKAEEQTDAEIVVAVAPRSGRYDRAEDLFGLLLGIFSLMIIANVWSLPAEPDSFDTSLRFAMPAGMVVTIFVLVTVIGVFVAGRVPGLARFFVPRRKMRRQVMRRGAVTFQQLRVRGTPDQLGTLIYISLWERMVLVVGDDAVNEKIDAWDQVRDEIRPHLKRREYAQGLIAGIESCGTLLAEHFPATGSDRDGLSGELHLLD